MNRTGILAAMVLALAMGACAGSRPGAECPTDDDRRARQGEECRPRCTSDYQGCRVMCSESIPANRDHTRCLTNCDTIFSGCVERCPADPAPARPCR